MAIVVDTERDYPNKTLSKGKQNGVLLTIYALFFVSPTLASISPALGALSEAYPHVSSAAMGYVVSITAIMQAIAALASGVVAGKLLRFQTIIIPSAILYVLAGCFPFFLPDGEGFAALLISRALFGAALGFLAPLGNALIMVFHDDEKRRAGIVGGGNIAMNIGTILTSLLAGFLCIISWQTTFLLHLLGVVLLVLTIVFLRDETFVLNPTLLKANAEQQKAAAAAMDEVAKVKLPFGVFGYLLMFLLVLVVTQPMVVYNATFIAEASLGTSVTAGITASVFSFGGIAAASCFRSLYKGLREWLCPSAFVVTSLAALLGYVSTGQAYGGILLYCIAIFLTGFGLLLVTCFTPIAISSITPPQLITTTMGMITFVMAGGSFLVTPFAQLMTSLAGTDSLRVVLLGSLAVGAMTALYLFVTCSVKNLIDRRQSTGGSDVADVDDSPEAALVAATEAIAAAEEALRAAEVALRVARKAAKEAQNRLHDTR